LASNPAINIAGQIMSFTCQPDREEKNLNREERCNECNT